MGTPTRITASLTPDKVKKLKQTDPEKYGHIPDEGVATEILYDYGDNVEEAVKFFSDPVIRSMVFGHMKFTIQSKMRDMLANGMKKDQIQKSFYDRDKKEHVWKPGLGQPRKSAVEKEKDRLKKLDPEKRKKEVEEMKRLLKEMEG